MKKAFRVIHAAELLRGEPEAIAGWTSEWDTQRVLFYVGLIIAGAGLYGASMGCWHDSSQAFYSAIKLSMVILLTTVGNAMLNGMLAPLLGINLGFRQSFLAILISFSIAAIILGGFSPLVFYMVWNTPLMGTTPTSLFNYRLLLLTQTLIIAFAGIMANVRLVRLLEHLSGSRVIARRVLLSWLAGNLFLGAQLSWVLRPFISLHEGHVGFFSPTPLQGNFYEAVFHMVKGLL